MTYVFVGTTAEIIGHVKFEKHGQTADLDPAIARPLVDRGLLIPQPEATQKAEE